MSTNDIITNTLVGAVSGAVEVLIMQPTVAIKNALQDQRPIPLTAPKELYRGVVVNVGSIAPLIAVQFGASSLYKNIYSNMVGRQVNQNSLEQLGITTLAGATSSLVITPAELVIIQQQRTQRTLWEELQRTRPAKLYRGVVPTICRESLWCTSYMGLVPVANNYLQSQGMDAWKSWAVSSVSVGIFASIVTQPFDVIKTRMQAHLDGGDLKQYRSFVSTTKTLLQEGGFGAMYLGYIPRTFRLICAVFILNGASDTLKSYI